MDPANPYAPPQATVHDVGDPSMALTPADRGTRLAAALLDGIIVAAMVYVPLLITAAAAGAADGTGGASGAATAALATGLALTAGGFVAWLWLTLTYLRRNGQSMAKKLLGIKIVRSDGSPASLGRIVWLRNVLNWLVSIIPLYGMIDVLFIFSESRQCLHDRLADTIVVNA
jgi:uncharacterized RDD family membrane protein YckC